MYTEERDILYIYIYITSKAGGYAESALTPPARTPPVRTPAPGVATEQELCLGSYFVI